MAIIIDGDPLADGAVEYEYQRLLQFYAQHIPASELEQQKGLLRKKAEEQAIGARLLQADADAQEITVPEYEVEPVIKDMLEACGSVDAFQAMVAEQHLTEDALRESIRNGRKVDILIEHLTVDLTVPTEEAVKTFFEAHTEDYMLPERVSARHVLAQIDAEDPNSKSVGTAKLNELRQKIAEGASFEDLAWTHSDCPSGRNSGGKLGWIGKGTLVSDLDDVLFELEVGVLSEVITTELGLHVIEILERLEPGPAEFDDVFEKVREFMVHAQRGDVIAAYVAELKKKAVIQQD